MTDYSELVQRLRRDGVAARDTLKCVEMAPTVDPEDALEAADAIEAQAKRIAELEHQMKVECDTFLWNRKRMSRHIAMLEYWMEKLFKFCSSPEARRNQMTMTTTTEIPDSLIKEGEDILQHLEERSDFEEGDDARKAAADWEASNRPLGEKENDIFTEREK